MQKPHLVIIPSVSVWKDGDSLIFDRKFYDGILLYVKMWPGDVSCIMSTEKAELPDFGLVNIQQSELLFRCVVLDVDQQIGINHLVGASIVLASGDSFNQFHVSKLCRRNNIRCVYIIENIPETRYQIAALRPTNYLVKLRRFFYIWNGERKRLSAFSIADGLQINGAAAYYEYKKFSNPMLYFDTRVNNYFIVNDRELELRLAHLSDDEPLRLAFSGRLISMKGVDHLVKMARLLKQKNIKFQLSIFGSGDLESEMHEYIDKYQLIDCVSMLGSVDFYKELIPNMKQKIDLFVCLHRQSDPSCTYLETLSCGVPIVGYTNRAFAGLLKISDIGWGARLDDLDEVVKIIGYLNENRDKIIIKSKNSMNFARQHNFENTFQNRIDHLYRLVQ